MDCQGRGTNIRFIHYRETLYHLHSSMMNIRFIVVSSASLLSMIGLSRRNSSKNVTDMLFCSPAIFTCFFCFCNSF